ncbi:MAG: hypothetical protein R3B69_02180 [Candidatus Paceibacterota bacterium]
MHFHVITLFPDVCQAYTDASVLGRAQKTDKGKGAKHRGKKITVSYYNPRDFSTNKHKKVDDRPYGGGPGMVIAAEPILKAWRKAVGRKQSQKVKTLIMAPRGKKFNTAMAKNSPNSMTTWCLSAVVMKVSTLELKKRLRQRRYQWVIMCSRVESCQRFPS